MGWVVSPGRTWRAWVRGRHSRSLYAEGYSDALLHETVGALRARLGLDRPAPVADRSPIGSPTPCGVRSRPRTRSSCSDFPSGRRR